MAKTHIQQYQISGSLPAAFDDQLSILKPEGASLVDDLNAIRTQLRKVIGASGHWDSAVSGAQDLAAIYAMVGASGADAHFKGDVFAASATLTGGLSVSGTSNLGVLNAGESTLAVLHVTGPADIAGTLSVTGAATFHSDVKVEGTLSGVTAAFSGDVDVIGKLSVTGDATFRANVQADHLHVVNDASITGGLTVDGTSSLGVLNAGLSTLSALSVTSGATFGSSISVTGTGTFGGKLVANAGLSVSGDAAVSGAVQAQSLGVTGAAVVGSLSTAGAVSASGAISATGAISTSSSLSVSGAAFVDGVLHGSTGAFSAGVSAASLTVSGAASANSLSVSTTGTFGNISSGAITSSDKVQAMILGVTGNASIGGSANISGAANVAGALSVTGAATLRNSLTLSALAGASGIAHISSAGVVSNSLLVNADVAAGAAIDGAKIVPYFTSSITGPSLFISGGASVSGALSVSGAISSAASISAPTGTLGYLSVTGAASVSSALSAGSVSSPSATLGYLSVTGASGASIAQKLQANSLGVTGNASIGSLTVVGDSQIATMTASGVVTAQSDLNVGGALSVTGTATLKSGLSVTGAVADFRAGVTANQVILDGASIGHLYLVGPSGEIKDSANLFYGAGALSVTGDIDATGNIWAADGHFSGNLYVQNDFFVSGSMTQIDTTNLRVQDAFIYLATGSHALGNLSSGIVLAGGAGQYADLVIGQDSGAGEVIFGKGNRAPDGDGSMAGIDLVPAWMSNLRLASVEGAEKGHLSVSGSDLELLASGNLSISANGQAFNFAVADDYAHYNTQFGNMSLISAIVSAASGGNFKQGVVTHAAKISAGAAIPYGNVGVLRDGAVADDGAKVVAMDVYLNGVRLAYSVDYAINSSKELSLVGLALEVDDVLQVVIHDAQA